MLIPRSSAFAANYTEAKQAAGTTTNFDKYFVMDAGTSVPNADFTFTIAPGMEKQATPGTQAVPESWEYDGSVYDTEQAAKAAVEAAQGDPSDIIHREAVAAAPATVAVMAGIGDPVITWDSNAGTGKENVVRFSRADSASTTASGTDSVKGLTVGKQYAKHTATVSFAGIRFPEPGIYRYIINETVPTAAERPQGVSYDTNPMRYLDVYVEDDGSGALSVDGYILHAADSAVPAGANAGSAGENTQTDNKSQGFTNVYESYELTVSNTVSGNQASHDKYFKINVKIENAPANAVYNVSLADDNNDSTADGNADVSPTANSATVYTGMTNPASITVNASGTVEQDFYLQHGQSIVIRGITPETKYTVTETQEDYKPSVTATSGTVDNAGNKVTVTSADADNTVAFTNSRAGTIPTGVIVTVLPYAITAACAAALLILLRKKKENSGEN